MQRLLNKMNKIAHEIVDDYRSSTNKEIIKRLTNYKYVSFDVFDTLLKRDTQTPTDVFELIENITQLSGFKNLRIRAEQLAREKNLNNEINLDQIYDQIDKFDNEQKEKLKRLEIDTEISLSCRNRRVFEIYQWCINNNKKVILISDMYLERPVIEKLLKKNGISGFEKLYVSNELNKTKADGSLYHYVLKDLSIKAKELIHIGNSFKADYINPKKNGINSVKIGTYEQNTTKKYNDILCDNSKKKYLNAFINNHTIYNRDNWYESFGYERFGPLLYGFINWLFQNMETDHVKKVLFLSRDGYIMRKVYHELGYDKIIPDYYFEASRRSLRIPNYDRRMTYQEILKELTVPNRTNVRQLFDSLGLNAENYLKEIESCGLDLDSHIKRDSLIDNQAFHKLYNIVEKDIFNNAEQERKYLIGYLNNIDFNQKIAIVDIGWGGSMQKYLIKTLNSLEIKNDIIGYYVGLTQKSISNLKNNNLKAKGYAFDAMNRNSDDMERPFVGLFEILFLEQDGSIKRYDFKDGQYFAIRYPYEYCNNGHPTYEAMAVAQIQNGALEFVHDYKNTFLAKNIFFDNNIMFSNLYQTGIEPNLEDTNKFGDFDFFNNGSKVKLAAPKNIPYYMGHIKELQKDLFDSQWKIGFLKRLLKIDLPYLQIFKTLRKATN